MTTNTTIIMPCYNAAAHLLRSVGSVLAQTRIDWELIIVDDGSADESWHQMQQLAASDPRIRVFRQANAGAPSARNRALTEARGKYAAFLDADDTWHPEFLAAMTSALDQDAQAGIAYCGWQNQGLGGDRDAPFVPPDYENANKVESLLGGCRWPIHAALVRFQLIRDAGCFDESLSSCEDYDLWLRIGSVCRLVRVPRVLAYYRHHSGERITRDRPRIALDHWQVQQNYFRRNPAIVASLGRKRVKELTDGALLQRGYTCYWQSDLPAARQIFRRVMRLGYGKPHDWKYMLPAWLPESWHRQLISFRRAFHGTGR